MEVPKKPFDVFLPGLRLLVWLKGVLIHGEDITKSSKPQA